MALLSKDELEIVADNPLDSLSNVRDGFCSAEDVKESDAKHHNPNLDAAPRYPTVYKGAMDKLLATLHSSRVSIILASRTGKDALASDLTAIRLRLTNKAGSSTNEIDYKQLRPLSQLVIKEAPDADIWNAFISLVTTINDASISSPQTSRSTRDDTPFTISSSSYEGAEQTRAKIEERMIDEIRYCTYEDVPSFHAKYFTGQRWNKKAESVWKEAKKQYDGKWTDFPEKPDQHSVYAWFLSMQEKLLPKGKSIYYRSDLTKMVGDEAKRRIDIIVKKAEASATKHKFKDVTVIGELKSSVYDWRATVLQLACYVRDVFTHQPMRHFVHAFALYGSEMETWVFDRSGPYSAGRFDIHEQPKRFIQILCGYVMMSDEELGLDTFTMQSGKKLAVELTGPRGKKRKLELDPNPIAHQQAVVCRGTTCYLAKKLWIKDYDCVVKLSWTSDKREAEWKLLKMAQEQDVKGVPKLEGYCEVTTIGELRKGLDFEKAKKHRFYGTAASVTISEQPQSTAQLPTSSTHGSQKRKSAVEGNDQSKRSRSNSVRNGIEASQEPDGVSLMMRNNEPFDNRVLRILAISPAGQSIRQFRSPAELVGTLRDAIKAHQSLYIDGRILHRDISENNIIITDPKKADGFRGMLIDLDLAKVVGGGPSGARHRTGTMQFMAIGVLQGDTHTYRHDLESFFYVLVWLSARRAWDLPRAGKRQGASRLTAWYTGFFDDMSRTKKGDMDKQEFERILHEIPRVFEAVKPLCRTLRDILFPYRDGLFTGTPEDPESLYSPMLAAFDSILHTMRAGN